MSQAKKFNLRDASKWTLVWLIVIVAVIANNYYASINIAIRAISLIFAGVVALGIAALTDKGKQAVKFLKESRMEMRKVVWPNRQETTQMTLIVIVLVVIMALVLWGVDSLFALLVSSIL